MIPLNPEAAIKQAIEITKIICANPNVKIQPNKQSAEDIAEFIRTLETNFLAEDQAP